MTVRIWSLDLDRLTADGWDGLESVLDATERARAQQFRFAPDRQSYVAAHGLLRHALSRLTGHLPETWRFAAGPHGKPHLADPPPGCRLRFSISHTRGMAAVAVAQGMEVGVDVEAADRAGLDLALAERFFAPEEAAGLRAIHDARRAREHFIALWTLKEAFVKALGTGLAQPLDSFAFHGLAPPRLTLHDPRLGPPQAWRCWTGIAGRYRLSACVRERAADG